MTGRVRELEVVRGRELDGATHPTRWYWRIRAANPEREILATGHQPYRWKSSAKRAGKRAMAGYDAVPLRGTEPGPYPQGTER